MNQTKHIHFIGICGVGMSALAILWKKKGWRVTGSDVGFYPPTSTNLDLHQVEYYAGWHTEKLNSPELVVVGNVAGSNNPEWQYVQNKKIPFVSYPELIAKNLIKQNSIVCAGTYGKTSSTSLLAWIFKNANLKPSYMFGGIAANDAFLAADDGDGNWSIVEGDEYKTSRWDNSAKFFSYQPTHLLLTAINWDHADIYPTNELYVNAFQKLIDLIPQNGLIVISENIKILKYSNINAIKTYGIKNSADYHYFNVQTTKQGLTFQISDSIATYEIKTKLIGEYMADNICGCFAISKEIGIPTETILSSIENFSGLKRRLEKRGQINQTDVYDDIAHSPAKAASTLKTLKKIYSGKIYAVFEPNTGNRQPQSAPSYHNAFLDADEVLIPKLTAIKKDINNQVEIFDGKKLIEIISQTHPHCQYIDQDNQLVDYLKTKTQPKDCVVFLGSHSFRHMIDDLIN